MNRTPQLLINTGCQVDQDGVLTGLVLADNCKTLNAPSVVTTYADTLNWIPSNAATLTTLNANNVKTLSLTPTANSAGKCNTWNALTTLNLESLEVIAMTLNGGLSSCGDFRNCASLVNLNLPNITRITNDFLSTGYSSSGTFQSCTNLESINFPSLEYIDGRDAGGTTSGAFNSCSRLHTVNLPSVKKITNYHFGRCTALTTVTLGSEGKPVQSISSNCFYNDTQSGLTITVYTSDGNSISGSPWGATNATIVWEEA